MIFIEKPPLWFWHLDGVDTGAWPRAYENVVHVTDHLRREEFIIDKVSSAREPGGSYMSTFKPPVNWPDRFHDAPDDTFSRMRRVCSHAIMWSSDAACSFVQRLRAQQRSHRTS